MSFYSSLILFRPGPAPTLTVANLRKFCDGLRTAFPLEEDDRQQVSLQYEDSNAAPRIAWDESGTIGTFDPDTFDLESSDHEQRDLPWPALWPALEQDARLVRGAHINLGFLSIAMSDELQAIDADDDSSGVTLFKLSVSVGPESPHSLDSDDFPEDECYGGLSVSFSGMGYFSWQPLAAYWEQVRQNDTIPRTLRLCREMFPTPATAQIAVLKTRLGKLFLNGQEYQSGDWIVSITESG